MKILSPSRKIPIRVAQPARGLINAIGRLANVLFGVCSDEDAKFFYSNIRNLHSTSDKSSALARDQLRIVESVV